METMTQNKIHPKLFALVVSFASIFMMFAGFTSAYIVKKMGGSWLDFEFPTMFFISTVVILFSSITLHFSYSSFNKGNEKSYKLFLLLSFILGIIFLGSQVKGYGEIVEQGYSFTDNASISFLIIISAVHAIHVLGGVAAIILAMIHAYFLPYKPTPVRKLRFQLTVWYWHFVDLLWLYLFIFF